MQSMINVIRNFVVLVKPQLENVIFDNDTSFGDLGFTTLDYGKLIFCIEASYEIDFVNHIRGNHYKVDSVSKICNELKLLVQ